MECTFESLPFPFPESQRAALQAWRQEAVLRERQHSARRQAELRQLQALIATRLKLRKQAPSERPRHQPHQPPSLTTTTSSQPLDRGDTHTTHSLCDGGAEKKLPSLAPPPRPHDPPTTAAGGLSDNNGGGHQKIIKHSPAPPAPPAPVDVYVKLTALGRGFLARRLLQSVKISSLIKTIQDGSVVLAGITEPASQQDAALRERVLTQVQLARLALHEALQLPVRERMAYIAHSRLLRQQRKEREMSAGQVVSHRRLSVATQKAIKRRQKPSSSTPIPPSQKPPVKLPKPVSKQDKIKLEQDRSSGRRGAHPHHPVTPQTLHPAQLAAQDKRKAKPVKTVASRGSGHGVTRVIVPAQGSTPGHTKSGQTKSGQLKPTPVRHRTQPLVTPAQDRTAKKSRTHVILG